jgi:sulfur carrier protein
MIDAMDELETDTAERITADVVPTPRVRVNGSLCLLEPEATVGSLIARWCESADGIAVARNSEVVPRSEWDDTALKNGDRVEILTAAAGG